VPTTASWWRPSTILGGGAGAIFRLLAERSWERATDTRVTQVYQVWGTAADDIYVVGGDELAGGFVLHNR
jgi:hypothetical protein